MTHASHKAVSIATATLLIASGAGYRLLANRIDTQTSYVLPLNQPLSSVPLELGPWRGEDVPLDKRVLSQDTMDDQYLNRVYVNTLSGQIVSVYVGYIGRSYRWLVHRPDICFPANGRQEISRKEIVTTVGGVKSVPCILHEFSSADALQPNTLVLASFIVNGRYTSNEHSRNASLFAKQAPYLTRVQLGTGLMHETAESAAVLHDLFARLTEPLEAAMPYIAKEGRVVVTEVVTALLTEDVASRAGGHVGSKTADADTESVQSR